MAVEPERDEVPDFGPLDEWPVAKGRTHVAVRVNKGEVMRRLLSFKLKADSSVEEASAKHPDLGALRAALRDDVGQEPALVELSGADIPSIAGDDLADWPVWFVVLPAGWKHRVSAMRDAETPSAYIGQHPANPRYITQWLCIGTGEPIPGSLHGVHMRVEDNLVMRTLQCGHACGGVLVIYECAGWLSWTGYAIDDDVIDTLRCGDVASCRDARFDHSEAELDEQARDIRENGVREDPSVLTPVVFGWQGNRSGH